MKESHGSDEKETEKVKEKESSLVKLIFIILIISVIASPILLSVFMHLDLFSKSLGDANGWLSYWGGYLGALIGAATVYFVTNIQMKKQTELHQETLKIQTELHNKNLIEQRNIQMESIKESAHINDLRQRDLVIAELRINKIEKIINDLIKLHGYNSDRFNIFRTYNQYNHRRIRIKKIIGIEIVLNKIEKKLNPKQIIKFKSPFKLKRKDLEKFNIKRHNLKSLIELKNKDNIACDNLLDEETKLRNEIMLVSATIKTEALFVGLDEQLDSFRGYQDQLLSLFYDLVVEDNTTEEHFYGIIESHRAKLMALVNDAIRLCQKSLQYELIIFRRKDR